MPSALGRFRMLDLSRQLPGPFCSMLLADLGMDVLAVYAPNDPMGMGIPLLGRNKRSCTLNLKVSEGHAIFHRLAREADVVLEGGRPGVAARLGVGSGREETGRDRFVDIAMMDGAVAWQVGNVFRHLLDGREPARGDTMLTGHHPCYAIYETRDGRHVTVGALEPHFWRTLCERLGLGEFAGQQFAEGSEREAMFARFRAKFCERSMAEWVDLLADLDICFGPVATLAEMMHDPQVRHRGMVVEMDDGRGVRRTTLGNPIKLSDTPPALRLPAPELGQHTEEVLVGLGYSRGHIAALRERGVI